MNISLAGQKALVTGGDSGIGVGIVLALADASAAVLINYHGAEASDAERLVSEIRASGGEAAACRADVSDEGSVAALFECM